MYYDASGTDYISTPSFAIPNTGILTVEAWMKSVTYSTSSQTILGDHAESSTVGFFWIRRETNSVNLHYYYANGITLPYAIFSNFFQGLDNQYIHIVLVCDYTNKTLKAYRNGVQFGATQNLTGTPVFPSSNRVKYIGAYSSTLRKLTDGSLDEVRIYNRGLSAEEIATIYNQTKGEY
jgi:hypothetical protein